MRLAVTQAPVRGMSQVLNQRMIEEGVRAVLTVRSGSGTFEIEMVAEGNEWKFTQLLGRKAAVNAMLTGVNL
jgi:hypothetical protein